MCKLTKKIAHPGGCWIFRIQGGGFDKGGVTVKIHEGLRPPSELCTYQTNRKPTLKIKNVTFITILPILNFLTDIQRIRASSFLGCSQELAF